MSVRILAGRGKKSAAGPSFITLTVSNNPELVQINASTHPDSQSFSGTYSPVAHASQVYISAAELTLLKADVAASASITVSIKYETTTNAVSRFCFPSKCVPS